MASNLLTMMENVSAVSAVLHQSDSYQQFYDRHAEALNGFPGIWTYCAEAGKVFSNCEAGKKLKAGEDYEWIEAIENYVGMLLNHETLPNEREMFTFASAAIEETSYDTKKSRPSR